MKTRLLKGIILSVIALVITWSSFTFLLQAYSVEVNEVSIVTYIYDGDTFEIHTGYTIRLADVNTPESGEWGYYEATEALNTLIFNRRVYLDIDDIHLTDIYGRLVCLVYIDYNSTHYLNVNKALLVGQYALLWDHDNEFQPESWSLFVPKLGLNRLFRLLVISIIPSIVAIFMINMVIRKVRKIVSR